MGVSTKVILTPVVTHALFMLFLVSSMFLHLPSFLYLCVFFFRHCPGLSVFVDLLFICSSFLICFVTYLYIIILSLFLSSFVS